jgi:hypothetical protein
MAGKRNIEDYLKSIEEKIFGYRRSLIWFGIIIIIFMALFPPWVLEGFREGGSSFRIAQGYSFILSPPNEGIMVHIDLSRFIIQCVPIVIIIVFFFFMIKRPLSNGEIKNDAIKSKHYAESSNDSIDIKESKNNFKPGKVVKWIVIGVVWLVVAGLSASLVRSCSGSLNKPTYPIVQAPTPPLKETPPVPEPVKNRFTKAQNGVITDSATGLEWYVGPDKDTNFRQAKSWAENLTVAGSGWRLPTMSEMRTIYHYQQETEEYIIDPIFQTPPTSVCPGIRLWSSENLPGDLNQFYRCFRTFAVRSRR